MSRDRLGHFELMILLAVLRHGDEAYGVPIVRAIEESTRRPVLVSSIYAALDRLQDKGFVASRMGDASPERGGKAKRYFRVTAAGLREARSARRALETLWRACRHWPGARDEIVRVGAVRSRLLDRLGPNEARSAIAGDLVEDIGGPLGTVAVVSSDRCCTAGSVSELTSYGWLALVPC
jgi:DNA-binding PadR family transcriptional regulator